MLLSAEHDGVLLAEGAGVLRGSDATGDSTEGFCAEVQISGWEHQHGGP